ncbi:MAG: DUF169 domain-containing protein [Desulfosarcinaceae bacterium]|nr:DUF169 domain-containing protein [Desulfosarcinaceae bacterium]
MESAIAEALPEFLTRLGLHEIPMGLAYTDHRPAEGLAPKASPLPTREKELAGEIDWQAVFGNFSCALGLIWRARRKQTAAYFSAEQFGCPGAAFWLGFNKPQTETIINYVSSGIPNWTDGEHYCESPEALRQIFAYVDPPAAPKPYCVVQPLTQFAAKATPEQVLFFCRPEALCGLHQLAAFVTNDPEVVVSPWSAACGSLAVWPRHYQARGLNKAVIGGWDPSARKFFKTDELSFAVPYAMFSEMIRRQGESFLATKTWRIVQKKIARSRQAWGEGDPAA